MKLRLFFFASKPIIDSFPPHTCSRSEYLQVCHDCGVCSLLSPKVIIRGAFSDQVMNVHITGLSDPVHAVLRLNQDLNEINTFHKCSGSTLHINYI